MQRVILWALKWFHPYGKKVATHTTYHRWDCGILEISLVESIIVDIGEAFIPVKTNHITTSISYTLNRNQGGHTSSKFVRRLVCRWVGLGLCPVTQKILHCLGVNNFMDTNHHLLQVATHTVYTNRFDISHNYIVQGKCIMPCMVKGCSKKHLALKPKVLVPAIVSHLKVIAV